MVFILLQTPWKHPSCERARVYLAFLIKYTWISSHLGARLRDWAGRQAEAGCYSWAALSSNDSKTRYTYLPRGKPTITSLWTFYLLLLCDVIRGSLGLLSTVDRIQGWKFSLGTFELSYGKCQRLLWFGWFVAFSKYISNGLYNSGLQASTYLKIIGLKVH